jgi:putative phosphoesterase
MKYLVFSDVHGNLPALENVLKKEENYVQGYINIGDSVNYGPWSNECVQLISELKNIKNICGNHETYFMSGKCDVKSSLVQLFFETTYKDFDKFDIIYEYHEQIEFNGFNLIHTIEDKKYIFKDSKIKLAMNIILGHSHQQFLRFQNGYLLINPGSIGQNRKYINVSDYIIWDTETGEIELKSLKFNLSYVISEMKHKQYPKKCLEYYTNKAVI